MPDDGAKLTADQQFELLKLELEVMQNSIARFDSNGLQVKTWCATTWVALEAFAIDGGKPRLALCGVAVALMFASVELLYRMYQWRFISRAQVLERDIATEGFLARYRYAVDASAMTATPRKELAYSFRATHFTILYVELALASVAVWWWM